MKEGMRKGKEEGEGGRGERTWSIFVNNSD